MSWFKFIFGLKFFKPVHANRFLFPFISDYYNGFVTMKSKIQTRLKKLNQI